MALLTYRKIDKVISEVHLWPLGTIIAFLVSIIKATSIGRVVGGEGIAHIYSTLIELRENRKFKVSVDGNFAPKSNACTFYHIFSPYQDPCESIFST